MIRIRPLSGTRTRSSRSLPTGKPIAILHQPKCFEVIFRRGFKWMMVPQGIDKMRYGRIIRALVFRGQIITSLLGRFARAGQKWSLQPDRPIFTEYLKPVELCCWISICSKAREDGNRGTVLRLKLNNSPIFADKRSE